MKDVRVVELAARQHNRFSRAQLLALGVTDREVRARLANGRWVAVHEGVYAIAPVLAGERSAWMAATLTDDGGFLSHASGGALHGWWNRPRSMEIVTRRGNGGPRAQDGLLIHRSETLEGDTTVVDGIPVTKVPRTLLDLAPHIGFRSLGERRRGPGARRRTRREPADARGQPEDRR